MVYLLSSFFIPHGGYGGTCFCLRSKRRRKRKDPTVESRKRGDATRALSLEFSMGLDWDKDKRREASKQKPTPLNAKQRAKFRRKNGLNSNTWQDLRARTQALADAAAPKPD